MKLFRTPIFIILLGILLFGCGSSSTSVTKPKTWKDFEGETCDVPDIITPGDPFEEEQKFQQKDSGSSQNINFGGAPRSVFKELPPMGQCGKGFIRMATWNLGQFTPTKAFDTSAKPKFVYPEFRGSAKDDPKGVEVVADFVSGQKLDVFAAQEVRDRIDGKGNILSSATDIISGFLGPNYIPFKGPVVGKIIVRRAKDTKKITARYKNYSPIWINKHRLDCNQPNPKGYNIGGSGSSKRVMNWIRCIVKIKPTRRHPDGSMIKPPSPPSNFNYIFANSHTAFKPAKSQVKKYKKFFKKYTGRSTFLRSGNPTGNYPGNYDVVIAGDHNISRVPEGNPPWGADLDVDNPKHPEPGSGSPIPPNPIVSGPTAPKFPGLPPGYPPISRDFTKVNPLDKAGSDKVYDDFIIWMPTFEDAFRKFIVPIAQVFYQNGAGGIDFDRVSNFSDHFPVMAIFHKLKDTD